MDWSEEFRGRCERSNCGELYQEYLLTIYNYVNHKMKLFSKDLFKFSSKETFPAFLVGSGSSTKFFGVFGFFFK